MIERPHLRDARMNLEGAQAGRDGATQALGAPGSKRAEPASSEPGERGLRSIAAPGHRGEPLSDFSRAPLRLCGPRLCCCARPVLEPRGARERILAGAFATRGCTTPSHAPLALPSDRSMM